MPLKTFEITEDNARAIKDESRRLGMTQTDIMNDIFLHEFSPKDLNIMKIKRKKLKEVK